MESVTIKLQEETSKEMEKLAKRFHYSTKTDFIREAIRDKIKQLEYEEFVKKLEKYKGAAKVKISDEEYERVREEIGRKYTKKFGIKLD